jgi:15-cis-phytoene synthase
MSRRELDAAGITDPRLRASYAQCQRLNAQHGRTYYLATLLLPPAKRPYVHALYGFARYADDLIDSLDTPDPDALVAWSDGFLRDLAAGRSDDPVSRATIDTIRRWDLPLEHFEAFLASMRMDITVTSYPTYDELVDYMYGSAAVIGLEMVPILGALTDEAHPRARALGEAFQLTNFIRDVGEDLRRGRLYLPEKDLASFGVDREELVHGVVTRRIRELLRFEIARTRERYAYAEPGIAMLHPTSRDCVRTAFELYGAILREVERADYQVLTQRVSVPVRRRLRVAGPAYARAVRARRAGPTTPTTPSTPR